MTDQTFELQDLTVHEVSLVPQGANQEAHMVLVKTANKRGDDMAQQNKEVAAGKEVKSSAPGNDTSKYEELLKSMGTELESLKKENEVLKEEGKKNQSLSKQFEDVLKDNDKLVGQIEELQKHNKMQDISKELSFLENSPVGLEKMAEIAYKLDAEDRKFLVETLGDLTKTIEASKAFSELGDVGREEDPSHLQKSKNRQALYQDIMKEYGVGKTEAVQIAIAQNYNIDRGGK